LRTKEEQEEEGFRLTQVQIERFWASAELRTGVETRRIRDIISLVNSGGLGLEEAQEQDVDFLRFVQRVKETINPDGPPE
jgi:hypothetical protein